MSANQQAAYTDTVQVILIGASGSGKSCSGNTILGQKLFRSEASAKSVTQKCEIATNIINGFMVKIVDTPGWDCTELNEDGIKTQITHALQGLQEPFSFLLVVRVGLMETKEEISYIDKLKSVLGPSFLEHTTILFTRSDDLEGKSFTDFLKEGNKEFRDLLKQCGNRCHCWNNRDSRPDDAVKELLKDLKRTETRKPHAQVKTHSKVENTSTFSSYSDQAENADTNKRSSYAKYSETHSSTNPVRVLFLGRNRVGKTSSIKTLLKECVQRENREGPIHTCTSLGLSLQLTESPGFNDNLEQIQRAISKSLSDCGPGPHVIIIVLSIERFTPEAQTAMKHVQDCLGQNARKHTMILFTGADNLEGNTTESFIQQNQHLSELVKIHQNRFHALNNRDTSNNTQVNTLLEMINGTYEQNNKEFYSSDSDHQQGKSSLLNKLNSRKWFK